MKKNKKKIYSSPISAKLIFLVVILTINFTLTNSSLAQSGEDPLSGTSVNEIMNNQPSSPSTPAATPNITSINPNSTGSPYRNQEKIPGASQQQNEFIPYLKDVINFGFAVIGILALFMLIIGAYQYLIAAGSGNVADAKDTILSALLGLILGLCAWIILNTINPDLVNMRSITQITGTSGTAGSPGSTGLGGAGNGVGGTGSANGGSGY